MTAVDATFRPDLFEGRVVLCSGASRGLGLAIARGFARCGAEVIAAGSSEANREEAWRDPANAGIRFEVLDVRSSEGVRAFAEKTSRLDVLVNAQGVIRGRDEYMLETFDDVVDVNLTSIMRLATALRPALAVSRGSILNIGSMASYLGAGPAPAYGTSKTAVLGLTRALAHEWGADGIRVNAISPGFHRTEMTEPYWDNPASAQAIEDRAALKRWGTAEDVVGAALFLSSPSAAFITGADLLVDGGYASAFTIG